MTIQRLGLGISNPFMNPMNQVAKQYLYSDGFFDLGFESNLGMIDIFFDEFIAKFLVNESFMDDALSGDKKTFSRMCQYPMLLNAMASNPLFWSKINADIVAFVKFLAGRAGLNPFDFWDVDDFFSSDTVINSINSERIAYNSMFPNDIALGKWMAARNGEPPDLYEDLDDFLVNSSGYAEMLGDLFSNADFLEDVLKSEHFKERIINLPWYDIVDRDPDNVIYDKIYDTVNNDSRFVLEYKTLSDIGDNWTDLSGDGECLILLQEFHSHTSFRDIDAVPRITGGGPVIDCYSCAYYKEYYWGGGSFKWYTGYSASDYDFYAHVVRLA